LEQIIKRTCLHCHKIITKGCRIRVTEIPKRNPYPSFYFDLCEQCRKAMKFSDQKMDHLYNHFLELKEILSHDNQAA